MPAPSTPDGEDGAALPADFSARLGALASVAKSLLGEMITVEATDDELLGDMARMFVRAHERALPLPTEDVVRERTRLVALRQNP